MHDRDTALLARTAAALRAQGRLDAADQLDAAVADRRAADVRRSPVVTPGAADLAGVRQGTFVLRDEHEPGTDG